jgi:hypothetical protein
VQTRSTPYSTLQGEEKSGTRTFFVKMPTQVEMKAALKRAGIKGGSTMKKEALQAAYTQMLAEDELCRGFAVYNQRLAETKPSPRRMEEMAPASKTTLGAGRGDGSTTASLVR